MIIGSHIIIQSKNAEADRAFLNRLAFPFVPMEGGFMIHGLPPSEVAIHPSDKNDVHEFWLMCDDIVDTIREMERAGIAATPVREASWGVMTTLTLPGGGKLGVYEPKHPRPKQHKPGKAKKAAAKKKVAKKAAKRKTTKKRRR